MRTFQAQVVIEHSNSSSRIDEMTLSWDRKMVVLGLIELRTGIGLHG